MAAVHFARSLGVGDAPVVDLLALRAGDLVALAKGDGTYRAWVAAPASERAGLVLHAIDGCVPAEVCACVESPREHFRGPARAFRDLQRLFCGLSLRAAQVAACFASGGEPALVAKLVAVLDEEPEFRLNYTRTGEALRWRLAGGEWATVCPDSVARVIAKGAIHMPVRFALASVWPRVAKRLKPYTTPARLFDVMDAHASRELSQAFDVFVAALVAECAREIGPRLVPGDEPEPEIDDVAFSPGGGGGGDDVW